MSIENNQFSRLILVLRQLNPQGRFDVNNYCIPSFILGSITGEDLKLPEGCYYDPEKGITVENATEPFLYRKI